MKNSKIILILLMLCSLSCCNNRKNTAFKYSLDIYSFSSDIEYIEEIKSNLIEVGYLEEDFLFVKSIIHTNSLDIIIDIKRMVAFDNLSSTSRPIVDLTLVDGDDNQFTIITSNPFIDNNNITWSDKKFYVSNLDKYLEYKVELIPSIMQMENDEILSKYFDSNTYLKDEYRPPDYNFVYTLIKKGFYVYTDSVTGRFAVQ